MNEELKNNSWRKFCNVDPKESFKNSDFEVPKEVSFLENCNSLFENGTKSRIRTQFNVTVYQYCHIL